MAIGELFFVGGPGSLLELSILSLFKGISKIIPQNTKRVEWCIKCKLGDNNCDNYQDGIKSHCNCFRYYQNVFDLISTLPFELQEKILEVAQKELDNSNSAQTLLGMKMFCLYFETKTVITRI